jgi:hypothetical protein
MKKCATVLILLLVAGCLNISGEQSISLSDFKNELNQSANVSIVADTRSAPETGVIINCGLALVTATSSMGKTPRFFAYESGRCFYSESGSSEVLNSSISDCESLMSNSTVFYVQYNSLKNSTTFYNSKAVVEGDSNFIADCQISKII